MIKQGLQGTLSLAKKIADDTKLTEKLKKSYLEKGKISNKSSKVKDDFEKVVTEGKDGKGKTITYVKKGSNLSKDKQVSKKAENLAKKQKKTKKIKKENVLSKDKQVDKAKQNRKAKQQKSTKSVDKKPSVEKLASDAKTKRDIKSNISDTKKKLDDLQVKDIKKKLNKKTTSNKKKSASSTKVPPTGAATSKNIFNKQKQSFAKRYKGPIAGATLLGLTTPYLIDTKKSKVSADDIKKQTPSKSIGPDIKVKKSPIPSVKKQKLPKVPTKTQKKSRSNIKGSSSYDAQFTYDQLKKRGLKPKGFMSPENFKKVKKLSAGDKVGLKDLPPKAENPGIHKLPAKAKMNMGFKPMFGGGLIASFYDKPKKTEKYKGNTTSARQVKGYGKAKKKA